MDDSDVEKGSNLKTKCDREVKLGDIVVVAMMIAYKENGQLGQINHT
jgi:hypothetical protein